MMTNLFIHILSIVCGLMAMIIDNYAGAYTLFGFALIHACVTAVLVWLEKRSKQSPKSPIRIAYKCDETLTCNKYCRDGEARSCYHTLNVKHAANFEEIEPGLFAEKTERETED